MAKRLIIALLLVGAFVGGLGYFQLVFKPQAIRGMLAKAVPPPAAVPAEPARLKRWDRRLAAVGTLVASQGIDVTSQVPGVVTNIHSDSGDDVATGAKLIELDTAVESADLASARAVLREAEVTFERQSDLITKKITSEANLDVARSKRDTAAAAVKKIEAVIAQKSIAAPFAGRLGIKKIEKGQFVSPGMPLVSLQALDPIRVDFPVPEQEISALSPGKEIEVAADAFPGQVFKGQIEKLDARVAQETRTLLVRALLPNKERKLLPGMFANVTIFVGAPADVVTVPRTAVTYSLFGDSVYVVTSAPAKSSGADGANASEADAKVVERRFVKVGPAREDRVSIESGLKAGEMIVTGGQLKLSAGQRVKIDNSQPMQAPAQRPRQ